MTLGEQVRWWAIAFAAFAVLLWLLSDALLPFVMGAALAYLTDPVADRLERLGLGRLLATTVIMAGAIGMALAATVVIVPLLAAQVQNAIANAPAYIDWLRQAAAQWHPELTGPDAPLQGLLDMLRERASGWSLTVLEKLWSGSLAVIDFLALAVITPVVAFYLLYDWDRMIAAIDHYLPRQHRDTIRHLMREIDRVLAGFVRGQMTVCAILGSFYAVLLSVIGLKFGLLIGAFAGLISFIPFVGSIVGGLVSVGVATAQFWAEPQMILAVAAVFGTGQVMEGKILTPKLVGGQVGLHPVWLIFALSAFGSLFGFVGLLVAVPAAAAIGVLSRFLMARYTEGRLYRGSAVPHAGTAAAETEEGG